MANTVPYRVRAASFEFERLPSFQSAGPRQQADTRVFPVRVHKVIEREFAPGDVPEELIAKRLQRREQSTELVYFFQEKGTYVWKSVAERPAEAP